MSGTIKEFLNGCERWISIGFRDGRTRMNCVLRGEASSRLGWGDDEFLVRSGLSFIDRNSIRGRFCGETIDREIGLLLQSQLNAFSHLSPREGKMSLNDRLKFNPIVDMVRFQSP